MTDDEQDKHPYRLSRIERDDVDEFLRFVTFFWTLLGTILIPAAVIAWFMSL